MVSINSACVPILFDISEYCGGPPKLMSTRLNKTELWAGLNQDEGVDKGAVK